MNIILTEKEGKVIRATIATGMFISESQSTEICKDDQEAAQGLLEYHAEGVYIAERDLDWARTNL